MLHIISYINRFQHVSRNKNNVYVSIYSLAYSSFLWFIVTYNATDLVATNATQHSRAPDPHDKI
jgi:hypothetical protein